MFKKVLVAFIVIGGFGFFQPSFLDRPAIGAIQLVMLGIMLTFMIVHLVYDHTPRIKPGFSMEFAMIGIAVILSMFGAFAYHDQSLKVSLLAQRTAYFFFFYPFLHLVKPDLKFVTRLILAIGIIWAILYIIQWSAYPVQIFGGRMSKDRNTIRISIPGGLFGVIAYYYAFLRFLKTNRVIYLLSILLLFLVFVLLGTRQLLAPVALISIWLLIRSKRVQSKLVLSLMIAVAAIPVYLIFSEIFEAMLEITRQQSASVTENVRYKATGFFLMFFSSNKMAFLTGNGAYSNHSAYGIMMENYSKMFGYYIADIGIIGEYILYGIVFIVAELIILFRLAFVRLPEEHMYINSFAYSAFLSLFVGSGLTGDVESILVFCLVLYATDAAKHQIEVRLKEGRAETDRF